MAGTPIPEWWQDIHRSCDNALKHYESLLDILEKTLSANINTNLECWTALQKEASSASEQISRSFHLADSRRRDAASMGYAPPEDKELHQRSFKASERSKKLNRKLRLQMKIIETDLSVRQPRRPVMNLYRSRTPSYIDVRV
ncbi:MAG: hypothetical protein J7L76_05300 [Spirochaetaceae bacterium]|nr:hypothetical protein [Spirochaetaceae bacterium]RKX87440.1 MAG: hypothetical protein DRP70_08450 [Spirochaetota bacterium]RKX88827.1 MAG: hypothetical protein DRZ90_17710 [Spirochaetota bacterium]